MPHLEAAHYAVFDCANRCGHRTELSADLWRDHLRLSDIEPQFVCTACGKRGAEVRPTFRQARMSSNA